MKLEDYETVIGLEVHVELATKTKIFCGCSTAFGGAPNTRICPVCAGMPGTLPVLHKKVVEFAVSVGLATNCRISPVTRFDRKNYFYPDNPQNYQISQLYLPICRDGFVELDLDKEALDDTAKSGGTNTAFTDGNRKNAGRKRIRIHEIHMEEDAGKLIHDEERGISLVDYNRAGVPLIEIVSEPDMGNAQEVIAYLEKLRELIRYLGVSDCRMQEGSMRADVNLSVRKTGEKKLGTRTEMKNLNSFTAIRHAIEGERKRQIALIEAGNAVLQETRRWDELKGESFSMRFKEDSRDYRYFPDPDLMPVRISDEWIECLKRRQPEFGREKRERFRIEYDLPDYDIRLITESKKMADIFEEASAICGQPKKVSNWLMGETMRLLKEKEMDAEEIGFSPENLASLIGLVGRGEITSTVAKEIFEVVFEKNVDPVQYVDENGLMTRRDETALRSIVEQVLAQNPKSVEDYRAGKQKAIGYLVGQTMKEMRGQADPQAVKELLEERMKCGQ